MLSRRIVLILLVVAAPAWGDDDADYRKDVNVLVTQGRGTAAGRAAWDRISSAGPALLPAVLEAMDTGDVVAANWLRSAFDRIVDRELAKGGRGFNIEKLLEFIRDARRQGRPRRLALELVERLKPGTSARLYTGWMDDPEFRYEAVAQALEEGRKLAGKGGKVEASAVYRRAFDASRDLMQARKAALGLRELGTKVSVGEHLGFLMDWYLIGPFDAMGMKGFRTEYAPEKKVDLKAEYEGQGKKIRWLRHRVREPEHSSGNRHQALVDLRGRDALGDADDAVAFAYTEFVIPEARHAEFRGAADDNFSVWVNGKRVFGFEEYRNGVRHDRHRFKVPLRAGTNTVLVKICQTPAPNPEPNWEFFLRVVDDTGKGIRMKDGL
jgi:hypothetical protein